MSTSQQPESAHLKRVLGRWDLVLLFVVAIVNLNVVPSVSASGGMTVWLWLISLVFFFWPQGMAVVELSHRYPGEGGIYLWTKKVFGDFHGFLSGWCYWTNNIFYVPTVVLIFLGIAVFTAGPKAVALANNPLFTFLSALILLVLLVFLNVVGLGVGKWVNNIGGIGTAIASLILIGLGITVTRRFGVNLTMHDMRIPMDLNLLSAFGIVCFALVGLELASIMGDEIQDPQKTIPFAVAWGGVISGILYIGCTITLLIAVPRAQISALQGIPQAVSSMSDKVGLPWLISPFAFVLAISIAGIASAWLSGSARIPFVAGLDSYLPSALGKLHPKFSTPYIALYVQTGISILFLAMSFIGAQVKEAFQTLLDLAVVLQLIPFLYMFAALIRLASSDSREGSYYSPLTLRIAGVSGFIVTCFGIALAFFPPPNITSKLAFEIKMWVGTIVLLLLAGFFFFVYGNRKTAPQPDASGA
ncbi:MAG TPA: APC family permease [Candidatus Angelobacter sp.]|nr:APC family permease [Candidatus Angelobacter sp.]